MRVLIRALVLVPLVSLSVYLGAYGGSDQFGTTWRTLRVGGGGFLTGIDISSDGSTRLARADTYGAYIWHAAVSEWIQLVTSSSMPASDVKVDSSAGVYEIRVAPSEPNRLYMAYRGYIYRSDDRGNRWIRTAFAQVAMDANDAFRTIGQKMAVDPANPDVVYVGTPQDGLFVTKNGGATWQLVDDIPKSTRTSKGYPGISGIVFDPSSGESGSTTKVLYLSSFGNGTYLTNDAGTSWKHLDGGPNSVDHAQIAGDGSYYVVGNEWSSVWCFRSGIWINITPDAKQLWDTVVTDPFDANHVIAVRSGGYLDISHDKGATWGGIIWGPAGRNYRVAQDVPWLAWTRESFMSVGDMLLDPVKPGRLWFAEGIGVWYSDLPDTAVSPQSITFTSRSAGIEQLVANQILAPPGGKPLLASWDRGVFYIDDPDVYPASHGPSGDDAIVMGWSLDYAATTPAFVAGVFNWWNLERSAYSTNGGRSWSAFPTYPPAVERGKIGGSIAVSTPANIVWAPSNNSVAYFTKDGGMTWNQISIPGIPSVGETGWGWGYFLRRRIVAADRVSAGCFYMYNYLKGLYRSTDGGTNWELVHHQIAPFSGFNAELQAVPDHSGHLFFSSGPQAVPSHPADNPFMGSIDGGRIWSAIPGVLEVRAFGFGKPLANYPTIYIVGWVNRIYGIWRSSDNAHSWTRIGDFPMGSLDNVTTIEGDKNVAGLVYVGFSGSGYAYGVSSDVSSAIPKTHP
jgi:photosystem II stability/assembly factor-like uncharacterized protein